ncbi:hypothetical protein KSX_35820 [Ktedonospora formicarum]|uniref:Uncharacterized protein n=1 Tax=Ktedonospora formicarum TaxID=2778364 RepID=A0A8J3HX72_9CHLR|nr:hypothetical protein KSX_35820 [Ktedonospora formicarum]
MLLGEPYQTSKAFQSGKAAKKNKAQKANNAKQEYKIPKGYGNQKDQYKQKNRRYVAVGSRGSALLRIHFRGALRRRRHCAWHIGHTTSVAFVSKHC